MGTILLFLSLAVEVECLALGQGGKKTEAGGGRREKGGVHTTIQTYVSATARLLILQPPLSQLLECAPHG